MPVLDPRRYHGSSSSAVSSGSALPGTVVGVVVFVMAVIFIVAYITLYSKAKKLRERTGAPVQHGSIFCHSLLYAVGVGFLVLLCASCMGDGNNNAGGGEGGGGGGGGEGNAGTVGQNPDMGFNQQPAPQPQPQMNWAPEQSAAEAPIQG